MREVADAERIKGFMSALGRPAGNPARVYFAGGATAVLLGWRATTIDVDIKIVPESDALFRAIPDIKESLQINVELASPADFIPLAPGWEDRSPFIQQVGQLSFHHFDLRAQALAKAERGHAQDLSDIGEMLRRGLVDPVAVRADFSKIEGALYRFPAIDPRSFRDAVDRQFGSDPGA